MLPPRRAPFGRRAVQPPPGAPTLTALDPHCEPAGDVPIYVCRGRSRETRAVVARATRPKACDLSHSLGHMPHLLSSGTGAAGSEGAGVRGGRRADRDEPPRVVRLPTADSLCDRMERGEEEATAGRRVAFRRSHFCRC